MKTAKHFTLVILVLLSIISYSQNPLFGGGSKNKTTEPDTTITTQQKVIDTNTQQKAVSSNNNNIEKSIPNIFQKLIAQTTIIQSKLSRKFSELGNKIKTEGSTSAFLLILLVSFIYGVVHAIGPGHGKFVIFSYFLSDNSNIKKGIILGNLIGLLHAISAIIIVLTAYFILKLSLSSSVEDASGTIQIISYGILSLLGFYLLYDAIKNAKNNNEEQNPDSNKKILPLALAVGMVPCPGTTIILIFSISAGILTTGLFASLAMALGMGITISVVGVLTVISKKALIKFTSKNSKTKSYIINTASILGAVMIIFLGVIMFFGSL